MASGEVNVSKECRVMEDVQKAYTSETPISSYSPLNLAYIGDTVYDLLVRSLLLRHGAVPTGTLNERAQKYVRASAQAAMYEYLERPGMLTEAEHHVLKRGRNAKTGSKAKNSSSADYHAATGVEALFGYLYLNSEFGRIVELFSSYMQEINNEEKQ